MELWRVRDGQCAARREMYSVLPLAQNWYSSAELIGVTAECC